MQKVFDKGGALLAECSDREMLQTLYLFGGHQDSSRIATVQGMPNTLGIYRQFEYGRDNRPHLVAYAVKEG